MCSSHGHLRPQFLELCFLVFFLRLLRLSFDYVDMMVSKIQSAMRKDFEARGLTLSVCRRRQPVDLVCHRDGAGLEHPLVHGLLFQTLQLGLELVLVGLFADGVVRDRCGDLLAELVLFAEFVPVKCVSSVHVETEGICSSQAREERGKDKATYIVSSTLSMLRLPWICAIAVPACFIALRVSWLIFAASIEYICCSSWAICAVVCSRFFSWTFFRRRAALAAGQQ